MTGKELAGTVEQIAKTLNTVYMKGVFGSLVTSSLIEQKARQYEAWYTLQRRSSFTSLIGKSFWAFDCVNLIKAILWGWSADPNKPFGGAVYQSNGVLDMSEDAMFFKCKEQSSDFTRIDIGEAVWLPGHIGIYIGAGKAVECSPAWRNGVQITTVGNIAKGGNVRKWKSHGKLPWLTYEKEEVELRYAKLKDIPEGVFRNTINDLMTAGVIQGDGSDKAGNNDVIDLSHDMVRVFVMNYRAGVYDKALAAVGSHRN